MQETDSPQLQETFMHRVSAIVLCTAVMQYNHNRNRVSLYYLFQEINHLVPIPFAFILWCTGSCVEHNNYYYFI
jgi:hypothetical protein